MNKILFTIPEVISLIGVFQCVYILVYVTFRAGDFFRTFLPLLYFFALGTAFFSDLARGYISDITPYYEIISWACWAFVTPISVLLIIQMARITTIPSIINWGILLVVPFAYYAAYLSAFYAIPSCDKNAVFCDDFYPLLEICGLIAGAISLLTIWASRDLFSDILKQKAGKERYWLILSLIIVNICFLLLTALKTTAFELYGEISLLRSILGLSFIYLVSTSLFRIYPQALFLKGVKHNQDTLNAEEVGIAEKISSLLMYEKIYHEATYSRTDLAQELGVSESTLSRVINIHFQKSFPQLLNERRVEDAKILLLDTNASIKIIAEEVGFNSLPSFNRVFKDLIGQSPGNYRKFTVK